MIKAIKAILIAIGFLAVVYMFSLLLTYCGVSVINWRKNGCKIKCLCKHEYTADSVWHYVNLKCEKCGKIIHIEMNDRWRDAIKDEFRKGNINEE